MICMKRFVMPLRQRTQKKKHKTGNCAFDKRAKTGIESVCPCHHGDTAGCIFDNRRKQERNSGNDTRNKSIDERKDQVKAG